MQPWIALLGVIDNGLVVLIMGLIAGKQLAATIRTSRIYCGDFLGGDRAVVVGTVFGNSIPTFSLLDSLLAVTNSLFRLADFVRGTRLHIKAKHG